MRTCVLVASCSRESRLGSQLLRVSCIRADLRIAGSIRRDWSQSASSSCRSTSPRALVQYPAMRAAWRARARRALAIGIPRSAWYIHDANVVVLIISALRATGSSRCSRTTRVCRHERQARFGWRAIAIGSPHWYTSTPRECEIKSLFGQTPLSSVVKENEERRPACRRRQN